MPILLGLLTQGRSLLFVVGRRCHVRGDHDLLVFVHNDLAIETIVEALIAGF